MRRQSRAAASMQSSRRVRGGAGSRTRIRGAVAVAAVVLLLTGCNAIPGSGPVQAGLENLEQAEQQVQFNPGGPAAGSSQEDVVRGFVLAAVSSEDDFAVAREFLTPDYAEQWSPDSDVLIDDGGRPFQQNDDGSGTLSVSATAKLDADGFMLPIEPGESTDLRFELQQVGGEWRISSAPNGIILDATTFTTLWSQHQLYFVGPAGTLVPETRWFLTRAALPTEIVGALLAGPGERLAEVVHSGFPAGTKLASNSVPVVDGRARVDLTGTVLEATPEALAEIRQQLRLSLQTVQNVNGVDLSAEGTAVRFDAADDASEPQPVNDMWDASALVGSEFGSFVSGEFEVAEGFAATLSDYDPSAITVNPSGDAVAILSPAGISRIDAAGVVAVDERRGLLPPMFDRFGYVWSLQVSQPQTMLATPKESSSVQVPAPWLEGRKAVAVRLSPDGSRIAVLVADEHGSQVLVAGVVRDNSGRPESVTTEADVQLWASGDPVDLDWVGQNRFAVLTKTDSTSRVTLGGVGLLPIDLGSVEGGVHLAGGSARTQLRVLGAGRELYASQANGWQRAATDVRVLAKRG
ncbi:LpqB family beta-propeller domain-containing protein [Leucobacter sp. USHLN153]|uniref:LpqB family beta-propeller domain-containing protein n=1 Tax=Leucobacter sp. USHLN153 TaxID=3081268 RepID=UPI003016A6F7